MIQVKIKKLSKNRNTFETNLDSLNFIYDIPQVGRRILATTSKLISPSWASSMVTSIEVTDQTFICTTLNSVYEVVFWNEEGF